MSTCFLSRGLAFRCEVQYPHSHWAGKGENVPDGVLSDSNISKQQKHYNNEAMDSFRPALRGEYDYRPCLGTAL